MQVDGEPWVQAPGHMIISPASLKVCELGGWQRGPAVAGSSLTLRGHGPGEALLSLETSPGGLRGEGCLLGGGRLEPLPHSCSRTAPRLPLPWNGMGCCWGFWPVLSPSPLTVPAPGQAHMLRKAKQKPKKTGTPKDARAEGAPASEGDPK